MIKLTKDSYIKIALIVALCLVICGGLGACSIYGCVKDSMQANKNATNNGRSSAPDRAGYVQTSEMNIAPDKAKSLEINWAAGSVDIKAVPDAETDGTIHAKESSPNNISRAQQMYTETSGVTLSINYGPSNGFLGCTNFGSKHLEVTIPESAAKTMESIEINGASGRYNLSGVKCQELEIDLASGKVEATDITAANLELDVASGTLDIQGEFTNYINASTMSGNTTITSTSRRFPPTINIDMSSGNTTLALPDNEGFTANVNKTSGMFSCDFQTIQQITQSGDNSYIYKNGENTINVSMLSGNMKIIKSNDKATAKSAAIANASQTE